MIVVIFARFQLLPLRLPPLVEDDLHRFRLCRRLRPPVGMSLDPTVAVCTEQSQKSSSACRILLVHQPCDETERRLVGLPTTGALSLDQLAPAHYVLCTAAVRAQKTYPLRRGRDPTTQTSP